MNRFMTKVLVLAAGIILLSLDVRGAKIIDVSRFNVEMKITPPSATRTKTCLNGQWDFDQTMDAFPPQEYIRKCPVPGLIHLAQPRIDDYEKLFKKPEQVLADEAYDFRNLDYEPKYSWYRKFVNVPDDLKGQEAMISILKSKYVTQV